ncbi:MAG: hypothetical protein J5523_04310 [Muribaculaceae bacterium]|nr:hypothetical protein [Muribaculaceae bacterium]
MDTPNNPNIPQQQSPQPPQQPDPNRKLKKWNIIIAIIDVILLLLLIFWPRQCGCNRTTVVTRTDTVVVHDTIPQERDIDQAVDDAGGETGYMGMKLVWNEDGQYRVDFDAHAYEPGGDHIYYLRHNQHKGQSPTSMGGLIDVDMIGPMGTGVENIMWPSKERLADGVYRFSVVNYEQLSGNNGFKVKIYVGNTSYIYQQTQAVREDATVKIADVTLQNGEIKDIKHYLQPVQEQ